jgi:hypothetical protein
MKLDAFEAVAKTLNEAGVRYIVAGGGLRSTRMATCASPPTSIS